MARGGKRPGAGKPKGYKHVKTLDKLAAREFVRAFVTAHLQPMLEAQVAHATGLKYLVIRDKKTGKFQRVGEALARQAQGSADEVIEVWEKDPSIAAFTDLANRCLDKPAEQEQAVALSGRLEIVWPDK